MVAMPLNQIKTHPLYLTYMYKENLALNNLQWLICQKAQIKFSQTNLNFLKDNCQDSFRPESKYFLESERFVQSFSHSL